MSIDPLHAALRRAAISAFLMLAGASALLACIAAPAQSDQVDASVAVIDEQTQGLIASTLTSISGTYGAGCTARSGSWSVRISGAGSLPNPVLSVNSGNSGCVLSVTSLVTDQTYTASPFTVTSAYAGSASAFSSGGILGFYANVKLSSTSFASDFVISVLVSSQPDVVSSNASATRSCLTTTPLWLTGFESGAVSSLGAAVTPSASLFNTVTGAATASTITARGGTYSLRVAKASGGSHYVAKTSMGTSTSVSIRLAVRFEALPTANQSELARIDITTGGDVVLGYDDTASNKLTLGFVGGTAQSSSAIMAGQWYRIDLRIDVASSPHTVDWRIDGIAQTQATISQSADTFAGAINLGSTVSADVYTAYYDDVLVLAGTGEYPLPYGSILSLKPNAYVGKADATGLLKDDTGAAVASGSEARLDEIPMTSLTDYIKQTAVGAAVYAEFGFADVTGTSCVNGVSGVVAMSSATVASNMAQTIIREGGTDRSIHNADISPGTSALEYRSLAIAPASGGWDATKLNGATTRIGYYSSSGGAPIWNAVMLEYDRMPTTCGPADVSVHRASGPGWMHLYTPDLATATTSPYAIETKDYFRVEAASGYEMEAFYRCLKSTNGLYFLTSSATCEGGASTMVEQIGYWSTTPRCGAVPLYRLYIDSAGDHFYTTSAAERDAAVGAGFTFEKISGYVWNTP